jgi:ribokinase
VQDTHGAGDAFIGALAARLARGEDLLAAVRFANAVGALMVMNVGPVATDMSEERVRKFLKEHTTTGKS